MFFMSKRKLFPSKQCTRPSKKFTHQQKALHNSGHKQTFQKWMCPQHSQILLKHGYTKSVPHYNSCWQSVRWIWGINWLFRDKETYCSAPNLGWALLLPNHPLSMSTQWYSTFCLHHMNRCDTLFTLVTPTLIRALDSPPAPLFHHYCAKYSHALLMFWFIADDKTDRKRSKLKKTSSNTLISWS